MGRLGLGHQGFAAGWIRKEPLQYWSELLWMFPVIPKDMDPIEFSNRVIQDSYHKKGRPMSVSVDMGAQGPAPKMSSWISVSTDHVFA